MKKGWNFSEDYSIRIDTFPSRNVTWSHTLRGLILSHGNADLEQGFSSANKMLTEEKSAMKEKTLNAVLI